MDAPVAYEALRLGGELEIQVPAHPPAPAQWYPSPFFDPPHHPWHFFFFFFFFFWIYFLKMQ